MDRFLRKFLFIPPSVTSWLNNFNCFCRVPIPVFYEEDTGEVLATRESMQHVAMLVERHGTNVWWELPVEELLAPEYRSNGKAYVKGMVRVRMCACFEWPGEILDLCIRIS